MTARLSRAALLRGAAVGGLIGLAGCASDPSSSDPSSSDPSSGRTPTAAATTRTTATPSPTGTAPATASATPPSSTAPAAVAPRIAATIASGLAVPWGIAFLPDGSALVSERDTARVLRVGPGGRVVTAGVVPDVVSNVDAGGEAGLLGLALHPSYPRQPWLYAYLSTASENRVVRMTYDGRRLGRPRVLLDGIDTSVHHNGGGLVFDADGLLRVSTGDAEDTANATDTGSLNGKTLRITDTGGTPADNPYGNPVWSIGHRNVEGLAVAPDGVVWASEFGDKAADELNRIRRAGDYGWPAVEGVSDDPSYVDPLAQWPTDDCSPSGVAIAAGRAWLGALRGECVYSVVLDGPRAGRVDRFFHGDHGRIRAVAAAPDGSLWIGTSSRDGRATPGPRDDRLLRVTLT